MRLSLRSVKLGSLFALAACLSAASAGCLFVGDDRDGRDPTPIPDDTQVPVEPELVTIDADAKLNADPGEGVGIFVEYATGGHWRVFTTCDYNTPTNPGYACQYDVFATVLDAGGEITNVNGEDLEGKDGIALRSDGTVHLYAENTVGLNGFTFDAPPGATVELEVYLDGVADPHVLYWVGKDVLHRGAPTDPLDLQPTEAPVAPPDDSGSAGSTP